MCCGKYITHTNRGSSQLTRGQFPIRAFHVIRGQMERNAMNYPNLHRFGILTPCS